MTFAEWWKQHYGNTPITDDHEIGVAALLAWDAAVEACALHLERSALRFPDDPRIQAVLRGEAESFRARKES